MKKQSTKKKIVLITITIITILLLFCIGFYLLKPQKQVAKPPKEKPTEEEPVIIKKLTVYDEDSAQRPIAIMIDNNIGNEYHSGLQESYLNYEIIVEGGLTRIMAIYKDKDLSQIGPVRSSRHYFLDYAMESDCIYAHFGWSTYAENDIKTLGINNINGLYDSYPFWRATHLYAPHNVFTSISKLYEYASEKNYSLTSTNWKLLNYTPDELDLNTPIRYDTIVNAETGTKEKAPITREGLLPATTIDIPYSYYQNRSYTYDSINKYYLRFMNGIAHIDADTKAQLHYKNIIIAYVNNYQLDSYGRQNLDTTGTGQGYYITNGYALPINWTKSSRNDKTRYTYSTGEEITVNDGNTFIQIVPIGKQVTIQ